MAGGVEVELKLEAGSADLAALAEAPVMAGGETSEAKQTSTYFDTAERVLRGAGLSLRVRQSRGKYVQTVKAEGPLAAGLFARPEWEKEITSNRPEIDDVGSPLVTMLPGAELGSMAPAFTAEVTRTTILLSRGDAEIEVVLDRGQVIAGDRSEPINEIELELKSGAPTALFSLARSIDKVVPMRLGVLTKSDRGYRLADDTSRKSVKADDGIVTTGMTVGDAFQAIASACLRHFRLNETILLRTRAPEPLHQARVALRRLRSALSIFKAVVQDDRYEQMRTDLRWLAGVLGDVRDIDVLCGRGVGGDMDQLAHARDQAYEAADTALASERVRVLMIDLAEWIAIGDWRIGPAASPARDLPVEPFAMETLDRLRRRVKRRGADLLHLSDEERHEVRILSKKLRYASEFFRSLFTGKKAQRRGKAFLAALEDLQQQLGDLNDIAHAASVLTRLGLEADMTEDEEKRDKLLHQAADAHEDLADARPFWR
jgi:triphosphatase